MYKRDYNHNNNCRHMGAGRNGQGEALAPWKCCKVLFVLQILSKVSVHDVLCIILRKCQLSGGYTQAHTGTLALDPAGRLPSFSF